MKWKRPSRVSTAIKRENSCAGSIKFESAQQQGITLYRPFKDELGETNSVDIKQEDTEDNVLNRHELKQAELGGETAQSRQQGDVYIKQEDGLEVDTLADAMALSDRDYYYQCSICKMRFDDYQLVMNHRRSVHNIKGYSTSIQHKDKTPDINDPNNFCQSCEKRYHKRSSYANHLGSTHHMFSKRRRARSLNDAAPYPNLHCRSCKITYTSKSHYTAHLERIHHMEIPLNYHTAIKNIDVLPDWNDPNFYCPSCERRYGTRSSFYQHCKQVHNMKNPSKPKYTDKELLDLHDPNFHCKICDMTHKTERMYRAHCYKVHSIRMVVSDSTTKLPNSINQCGVCSKTFSTKHYLNKHLFVFHKMDDDSMPPRNIKPDVNDPDFYCRDCEKYFGSKKSYTCHLVLFHSIGKMAQESNESKPDVDDPNNYCRVCQHTFATYKTYRVHILCFHRMTIHRPVAYSPNHFPDPLDPNWYCCVCKSHYKSHRQYRMHCRGVHRMMLAPLSRFNANPNADIDVNDPNHYCAKCDRKMKTRQTFQEHLKLHGVKVSRETRKPPEATVGPKNPNLYCAQCQRHYCTASYVKKHLKKMHPFA